MKWATDIQQFDRQWLARLWSKIKFRHRHKWKTTHTNQWFWPTRQVCKCGAERKVERANDAKELVMSFVWRYSDGRPDQPINMWSDWENQ